MALTFDHVFICSDNPQAAERALTNFGLQFSRRRIHCGQGTANACAFFDNAYLELLWRHDDDELQSEVVGPVGLWQRVRWRETGASPFGIAFRPEGNEVPVETWPGPISSGRSKPSYRDATVPMAGTSRVHFAHVAGTRDIAA